MIKFFCKKINCCLFESFHQSLDYRKSIRFLQNRAKFEMLTNQNNNKQMSKIENFSRQPETALLHLLENESEIQIVDVRNFLSFD